MEPFDPSNLPINIEASGSIRHETKRLIFREEKANFKVCEPIEREKSEWFGFRKKRIFVHRTDDDKWDFLII